MASGIVTVGTVSASFKVAVDPSVGLRLQNLSANDVWIDFGQAAVAGSCLHLPANQIELVSIPIQYASDGSVKSINAIASATGSKVFYVY